MVVALVCGVVLVPIFAIGGWAMLSKDGREIARYMLIAVFRLFN